MPITGRVRTGYRNTLHPIGQIYVIDVRLAIIPTDVTAPLFGSGEEGDVSNATVAVTFSESIVASNYVTGVTIKFNGVAATIGSAARQANLDTVYYTINTPWADANDAITFEYSDILGDYADLSNNQLGDVVATAITNDVGRHLRFDDAPNSMHIAWT